MVVQTVLTDKQPWEWMHVRDGDPTVRTIFNRHYSRRHYKDGRQPKLFVGPGEKMVLRTVDATAICVWRKFIDDAQPQQHGVNCAVFRNEGPHLASLLLAGAMIEAWSRWPGERLYTYVDSRKIRSTNPGYCFLKAGWVREGHTKGGLRILSIAGT